jgi:hypothetical protein
MHAKRWGRRPGPVQSPQLLSTSSAIGHDGARARAPAESRGQAVCPLLAHDVAARARVRVQPWRGRRPIRVEPRDGVRPFAIIWERLHGGMGVGRSHVIVVCCCRGRSITISRVVSLVPFSVLSRATRAQLALAAIQSFFPSCFVLFSAGIGEGGAQGGSSTEQFVWFGRVSGVELTISARECACSAAYEVNQQEQCSEHGFICHLFELILLIHANISNGTNHIV